MRIEIIDEPIRVLAACGGGQMEPRRFEWSGRSLRVESINGRWVDRQGEGYRLHFSVQVGDETYLLHFASGQVQWWLDKLILTG